jgi:hypothetical protein
MYDNDEYRETIKAKVRRNGRPWKTKYPRSYFREQGRKGGNPWLKATKGVKFPTSKGIQNLAKIIGEGDDI